MKTFRKALSIILGAAIMLSCLFGMQVSVAAEGTVAVSVGEATVADGVVTVPVVATGSLQAFTVTVDYDNTVLTLADAEKVALPDVEDSAVFGPTDAETFKMMWAFALEEADVVLDNTQIATLTFNVVDEAAEATDITLTVTEAWDVAGNEVAATAGVNTVTLKTEPAEPVVDSTLVFAAKPSVVYGTASIEMAFRVANTVLAKYADVKMVIIPQKYDTATLNLVETPAEIVVNQEDLVKAGSTRKQYYFKDLFLYELGLDINYLLRGYDEAGNLVAVSETFTTSPATWLKDNISSSTDAKFKTMATDTLVVCDEVVKSVATSYPDSDLAKATSVIEGFDTSAATETIGEYNTVNTFASNNSDFGTANADVHQVRTSAQTEKVTFINLRIKDANKVLDWSKLQVNVSYTSKDSAGDHFRSYTYDADDFTWAGRYINVKFDQVGIHDSNKDILFKVIYDGADICSYTYSVETYLGANLNTVIGAMNTALMKLGQSFRAYQNL